MLPSILIILSLSGAAAVSLPPPCSVRELKQSPGYRWRTERIAQMVDSATRIVRARAISADSLSQTVTFESIEWLRGVKENPITFKLDGYAVEFDDVNDATVPYQMVRLAGQRGDCFAREYRLGAEYLLLLQDRPRANMIQWWPLAPVNEQLRGEDDPWLAWVRDRAATRVAPR